MTRRRVVVRPEFFDRLDELLPEERTPEGDPSTADFILHDLTAVIDALAEDFEATTLPVTESDARLFVFAGMTMPYVAIFARKLDDTLIELLWIDIERGR